ncbi:MAG: hypothetical protein RIR70_96 [Pseudomonadota bacterium]
MPGHDSTTLAALAVALDAANVRQQVAATNIANANVAGYTPLTASFTAHMGTLEGTPRAKLNVNLAPQLDANGQPQSVRIDDEMSRIAQNALHYQALVKGVNHYFATLGSAVSEGKK